MSHIESAIIRAMIATLLIVAAFSGFRAGATRPIASGANVDPSGVVALAHADAPPVSVMRPALATAEAQGRRAAHLRWLFRVYLPRHKAHSKTQGNHWQAPIRPTPEPVMSRLNAGLAHVAAPLRAAAGAGIENSMLMAFSSFGEPFATPEIVHEIDELSGTFGTDPAIVAGLYMHEAGNVGRFGNPMLYATHNVGNVKCMYNPCYWNAAVGSWFQSYPSYRAAIADWFRLYDHYYYDLGIHDLGRFVATYCPGGVDGNSAPGVYTGDVISKANAIKIGW